MALKDFEAFLATPGKKTDAQVVAAMTESGVNEVDAARVLGLPVQEVTARVGAVRNASTTGPALYVNANPAYQQFGRFLGTPNVTDAQVVSEMRRLGLNVNDVAAITNMPIDQITARMNALTPKPVATPTKPLYTNADPKLQEFGRFLGTPGVTDAQIVAEMNRLGITGQQVAGITNMPINEVQNRISNLLPFSNATQGFEQNFRNYTTIPIGAQYNPNITGGVSPYGQVMGQMQPLNNPYAKVQSGLSMGGYDPNIYDKNLLSNFVQSRADKLAAEKLASANSNAAVGDYNGAGYPGRTDLAPVESMGGTVEGFSNADKGGMFGGAQSGDVGFASGGLIGRVGGKDPSGPDDGQINAQIGEYVVRKSAVNKYGKGLLDMINSGKIPAKKIKSLLD